MIRRQYQLREQIDEFLDEYRQEPKARAITLDENDWKSLLLIGGLLYNLANILDPTSKLRVYQTWDAIAAEGEEPDEDPKYEDTYRQEFKKYFTKYYGEPDQQQQQVGGHSARDENL
ncbi:MAG: hypothetical protein Q9218_007043 [Villophora microphyllina]